LVLYAKTLSTVEQWNFRRQHGRREEPALVPWITHSPTPSTADSFFLFQGEWKCRAWIKLNDVVQYLSPAVLHR